ncbi:DUF6686 family protein [Spongiimicrobium salis]|uniref:DUF6686 family protein n=1 Tax=Spongiimicrobium salis TaxID=1667022 RepID=UPI00374D9D27
MCSQVKTIAKNGYGQLSFCRSCNVFHLTFNNIYIEFTTGEMEAFQKFVRGIDVEYWETRYDQMPVERKIPIQTMQHNLSMIFNKQELEALKDLVLERTTKPFSKIGTLDIDYIFFLN